MPPAYVVGISQVLIFHGCASVWVDDYIGPRMVDCELICLLLDVLLHVDFVLGLGYYASRGVICGTLGSV